MASDGQDDPLAYGDYHPRGQGGGPGQPEEGDRGLFGDAYRKLRDRVQPQQAYPNSTGADRPPDHGQSYPSSSTASSGTTKPSTGLLGSSIFGKVQDAVHVLGAEVAERLTGRNSSASNETPLGHTQDAARNRYGSFASSNGGDDVKWYVDGCGYMWAVSTALEQAKETVWILDCELTP